MVTKWCIWNLCLKEAYMKIMIKRSVYKINRTTLFEPKCIWKTIKTTLSSVKVKTVLKKKKINKLSDEDCIKSPNSY